jgi:hypothetical protein
MYAIIGAVESMQNAVALSQIQNSVTTSYTSEVLKAALGEANNELSSLVSGMSGSSGDDLQRRQAEYQKESQKWSSIETQLNANVQVAQDMTSRDAQHQQALVQFASVTNGITTYVSGLVQSSY